MLGLTLEPTLGIVRRNANPLSIFPTGLFTWHDVQDLTAMFADMSGTVATVGQPVAVVLDKCKGATFGPEKVTPGAFAGGTGWTATSLGGTAVAASGALTQSGTYTNGRLYKLSFTAVVTSGSLAVTIAGGASLPVTTSGAKTLFLIAGASGGISFAATSFTGSIDLCSACEALGAPMYQTTTAQCPILRQAANGRYYLETDGITHNMLTPSVDLSAGDKVALFTAVRKQSDAALGVVVEHSTSVFNNAGSFGLLAPITAAANYGFITRGSAGQVTAPTANSFAAPITNVLTGLTDIAAPSATLRVNGAVAVTNNTTQGTGNFGNYPLYYFRRGGTSLPFNGRWFGDIGFAGVPTASQIAWAEAYYNSLSGAY